MEELEIQIHNYREYHFLIPQVVQHQPHHDVMLDLIVNDVRE